MKMSLKLLVSSALVAVVCGCTTTPDSQKEYNQEWSYAKNISMLFGFGKDKKTLEPISSSNKALTTALTVYNTALLAPAKAVAVPVKHAITSAVSVPNEENMGETVGPSSSHGAPATNLKKLKSNLITIGSVLKGDDPNKVDSVFGYVPMTKAKSFDDARMYIVTEVINSFEKAAKELRIPMKMFKDGSGFSAYKVPGGEVNYAYADLTWVDEQKGCLYWKDAKFDEQTCRFSAYAPYYYWKQETLNTEIPYFISAEKVNAWKIYPGLASWPTILINEGEQKTIDYHELAKVASKYLPDYIYVYLAERENRDGKFQPAILIEKGKVNYFLSPQKNK